MSILEKAKAAWGGDAPDWIIILARRCDTQSQTAVASFLNVNGGYVSYALRNQHEAYHGRVEDAVRSRLMGETIECPVLGEIAPDVCRQHRQSRLRALGPVQKRLRDACPDCIHNTNRPQHQSEDTDHVE